MRHDDEERAVEALSERASPSPATPKLKLRAPTPPVRRAAGLGASPGKLGAPAPLTPIKWDADSAALFTDAPDGNGADQIPPTKLPSKSKSPGGRRKDQKGNKGKGKGKKGKGKGKNKDQKGKGRGKSWRVVNLNREHVVIPGKDTNQGGGAKVKQK